VAVFVAVSLTMLVAFVAMVVDLGLVFVTRNELQRAADAAALAGASAYFTDNGLARSPDLAELIQDRAVSFSEANPTLKTPTHPILDDIVVGYFDFDAPQDPLQEVGLEFANAVQITLRRSEGSPDGPVPFLFAQVLGHEFANVTASATAAMDDRFSGLDLPCGLNLVYEHDSNGNENDDGDEADEGDDGQDDHGDDADSHDENDDHDEHGDDGGGEDGDDHHDGGHDDHGDDDGHDDGGDEHEGHEQHDGHNEHHGHDDHDGQDDHDGGDDGHDDGDDGDHDDGDDGDDGGHDDHGDDDGEDDGHDDEGDDHDEHGDDHEGDDGDHDGGDDGDHQDDDGEGHDDDHDEHGDHGDDGHDDHGEEGGSDDESGENGCGDVPGFLPLTIEQTYYDDMSETGPDDFSYQDGVEPTGDDIPEVVLEAPQDSEPDVGDDEGDDEMQPDATGSDLESGDGEDAPPLPYGMLFSDELTAEFQDNDMDYFDENGDPVTHEIAGEATLPDEFLSFLDGHVGEVVGFFLHDEVNEEDGTQVYRTVGVRFGRIMDVGDGLLVLQPVAYTSSYVDVDDDAPPTDGQIGRVVLVR